MKRASRTALRAILVGAGIRHVIASRIERAIDRDDYIGLTSDDVAGCLIRWCSSEADKAFEAGSLFGTPFVPLDMQGVGPQRLLA